MKALVTPKSSYIWKSVLLYILKKSNKKKIRQKTSLGNNQEKRKLSQKP